ncbi:translation elongation factor Ts [Pokkaliibacter sp. CJK22405]|uniref:translation elongation factor Ts n=1 Tax=Pokkaliibacter sp. CJK22405 TaxID=3384615 RepID=UPI003984CACF
MAAISASMVKDLRERTGLGMMECKNALVEANGDIDVAIDNLRKSSALKAAKKSGRTAADGVVAVKQADDNSYAVVVEVNSETDFVARDDNFAAFAGEVLDAVFAGKQTDIAALMDGDLENKRSALVQKIGENISVRRAAVLEGDVVGAYVHSNNRIAVLVSLKGGNAEVAKDVAMHVAASNPQVVKPADMPQELIEKEKEIFSAQAQESGKPAEIIEKMVQGRIQKFLAESSLINQPFVKNPEVTVGDMAKQAGAEVVSFIRFEVGDGIEVEKKDFAQEVAEQLKG